MHESVTAKPRLLVVEDDRDNRRTLCMLLADYGYDVTPASSLAMALTLIDTETFQFILTDSFARSPEAVLTSLQVLLERAHPIPVGISTGWQLSEDDAERAGFAFVLIKPYDFNHLFARIASALDIPLKPEQERQAETVRQYFAMLTARDWDALVNLCTDDVTYELPGSTPFSGTIVGKAAFRTYTEETFSAFPEAHFEEVRLYASPTGLAARFKSRWHAPDGSIQQLTGGTYFQFAGDRINQIGVKVNDERLRTLLSPPS